MKVPEPLFVVVNPVVKALLRSPLHFLLGKSLALITFKGRKSGRILTTPVRYSRDGDVARIFTMREVPWWRNLRGGATVALTLDGEMVDYTATVEETDMARIERILREHLSQYPQDAVYHNISSSKEGVLSSSDLAKAAQEAILIEARPAI